MTDLRLPWRYEFNENGGHDADSAAYDILNADGRRIFVIDIDGFVSAIDLFQERFAPNADAEAHAKAIVDAVNATVAP
jgi:hypothetical protein